MGRNTLFSIVAIAILSLGVLGGGVAFYLKRGMERSAEGLFAAIESESLSQAQGFLARSLRTPEGDAWLKTTLAESELLDARSTNWTEQKSDKGFGELTGTVTRERGGVVPIRLLFVREHLAWKLYAIRRPFNEEMPEPIAPLIPDKHEQVTLVKRAIRDFAASVQSRNMSYFRSTLAPSRRALYTTEKLNEAFGGFFDIQEDLASLETVEPSVDEATRSDASGEVTMRGHFNTSPKQVHFLQKYAYEQTDWRLLSFKIDIK